MKGWLMEMFHEENGGSLIWLVVSKIFYFHPDLGQIPNLTHIFKGVETTN